MEKCSQEIIIRNKQGLHARPAAMFVQIANKYNAAVSISKDKEVVDGKSIIAVLSLGATKGSHITLMLEGEDAYAALAELKGFLESDE